MKSDQRAIVYHVPVEKIQDALNDMQQIWAGGCSYVKECTYMQVRDAYSVLLMMTSYDPILEDHLRKWEKK